MDPPTPSDICIHGDARRDEPYALALAGRRAEALITDPPYCLLIRRRKRGDLRDKKGRKIDREPVVRFESVREYRAFTEEWLPRAISHLTADAPMVVWTNFLGKEPIRTVAEKVGYRHLWGEFVWAKRTTSSSGSEELLRVYEVALVLHRAPRPKPSPVDLPIAWAVVAGYDDEGEAEAWGSHPHHKPYGVLEPLLRTWTRVGSLVLDPFAGSGSIPAAAKRLGRQVACLELEPSWVTRVTERLSATARVD